MPCRAFIDSNAKTFGLAVPANLGLNALSGIY